jgi:peptide-methionine (S)-S-oxide reductase
MADKLEVAVFGGGCFWCTEAIFGRLRGVHSVTSGYAGGTTENPTYDEVSSGKTGHAEVIKIDFDPKVISYQQLVEIFLHTHNPTTPNQQGADRGTQYRSIILTTNPHQKEIAQQEIEKFDQDKIYSDPAVTEVVDLNQFYPAEDYHERYFERNQEAPYCQVVIHPKLQKFRQKYQELLQEPA